jgi:DNA-directed RNA polymerase subunit beta'
VLDTDVNNFDRLRIGLASSEQIRGWSKGEVKKPETINYRTLKPEKDGLFCEKIFGPTRDWECYCGKYKRVRFKGIVCERCGVEVTRAKVRRERMGHIELAAPVSHIWYFKGVPSRMGYLLDIAPKDLEKVLYFASSIITSVNDEDREADLSMLKDELQADLEQLEAEKAEEIAERESERDRLVAVAKGEAEPEEGDEVVDDASVNDRVKKIEKETEREVRDIEEEYADKRQLLQDAFDQFQKLTVKTLINDESLYREMKSRYGDYFRGGMGAEAIKDLLEQVDLDGLTEELRTQIREGKGQKRQKAIKRLKVVDALDRSANRPEWMILDAVPVIPPDLRPMVQLDGGRFATSDLNDLYRRVINRNNRLKRLLDLGAPEIIVNNEKRMLQEAVDALFDNGRRGRPVTGPGNRPLKSLSDMLKGKQGRFRQNLLGKRVDYSGRSVIVVGPELKLHQCGLPKTMALELFKPFVMKRLVDLEMAQNIKSAKRMVDRGDMRVWDVLEEVIQDHPVLLNRAPTLHRLGIQAFEPVLVEGKAIRIHPLVCTAFNADFDGDQMAVHLPLSAEAQAEARTLMLSTNNIKSPAHGRPLTTPTQDMVIGLYYLTADRPGMPGEDRAFMSPDEAMLAYDSRADLDLQAKITVRLDEDMLEEYVEDGVDKLRERAAGERIETTVGRITFNRSLPDDYPYINHEIDKKGVGRIVEDCSARYPTVEMAQILDEVKRLGFHYATRAGVTVSVHDAVIPEEKGEILATADNDVDRIDEQYDMGLITRDERHRQTVDVWTRATDDVGDAMADAFDKFNPIYMMAYSGARGNIKQIRQLAGMRGLMANPKGDIIDRPIKANFREGLTVLEYFISTHGARKGLADTALRTADSGYLTRRLVDVAQDVIVREADCGTDEGVTFPLGKDGGVDRTLIGRVLLEPAKVPRGRKEYKPAGEYIQSEEELESLAAEGVESITVRTVMTCHAKHGICQKCYGWDLASGRAVDIGTAVGIIAAQSIGEPGTQLTMRTFHTGGVAGEDITHGLPRVTELFEARKPKGQAILAEIAGTLTIEDEEKTRTLLVTSKDGKEKSYSVSRRSRLRPGVADGAEVDLGQQLTEGSVNPHDLLALKGPNDTLRYIVDQVQDVYRSQGVDINDKHIEVIARQMLRKISITAPGDADFLPGSLVDRLVFQRANEDAISSGGSPATGAPVLLGITKASLATDSFLSAASFQETTRVLTDAAIAGKEDELLGLKENVIIGKLIPAATGMQRYRRVQLTYKGQSVEWDRAAEGPLPEFAPEELKEVEALLPAVPEISAEAEALRMFGDLATDEEGEIDVSAFAGAVFDPAVIAAARGEDGEAAPRPCGATTREGAPCRNNARPGSEYCTTHASLDPTLEDLGVSARWAHVLADNGLTTIADVYGMTEEELIGLPGIGPKAVAEVRDVLEQKGIVLHHRDLLEHKPA